MLLLVKLSEQIAINSEMEKVVKEDLADFKVSEIAILNTNDNSYSLFNDENDEELCKIYFDEIAEITTIITDLD